MNRPNELTDELMCTVDISAVTNLGEVVVKSMPATVTSFAQLCSRREQTLICIHNLHHAKSTFYTCETSECLDQAEYIHRWIGLNI